MFFVCRHATLLLRVPPCDAARFSRLSLLPCCFTPAPLTLMPIRCLMLPCHYAILYGAKILICCHAGMITRRCRHAVYAYDAAIATAAAITLLFRHCRCCFLLRCRRYAMLKYGDTLLIAIFRYMPPWPPLPLLDTPCHADAAAQALMPRCFTLDFC